MPRPLDVSIKVAQVEDAYSPQEWECMNGRHYIVFVCECGQEYGYIAESPQSVGIAMQEAYDAMLGCPCHA